MSLEERSQTRSPLETMEKRGDFILSAARYLSAQELSRAHRDMMVQPVYSRFHQPLFDTRLIEELCIRAGEQKERFCMTTNKRYISDRNLFSSDRRKEYELQPHEREILQEIDPLGFVGHVHAMGCKESMGRVLRSMIPDGLVFSIQSALVGEELYIAVLERPQGSTKEPYRVLAAVDTVSHLQNNTSQGIHPLAAQFHD